MSKLLIFPILLTSFLSLNAYAISCKSLLNGFEKTNSLLGLLAPLDIDSLVKNVDLGPSGSIETLNPRTDVVAYTAKDNNLLSDTGFGVDTLSVRDRIVETDFGYDLFILLPWGFLGSISDSTRFLRILWIIKIVRVKKLTKILDQKYVNPILRKIKNDKT